MSLSSLFFHEISLNVNSFNHIHESFMRLTELLIETYIFVANGLYESRKQMIGMSQGHHWGKSLCHVKLEFTKYLSGQTMGTRYRREEQEEQEN